MKKLLLTMATSTLLWSTYLSADCIDSECGSGGGGQLGLSGSQSQAQENVINQAPTLAISANQSNMFSAEVPVAGVGTSFEGFNSNSNCPTNTFSFGVVGGANQMESHPSRNRSHSESVNIGAMVTMPWGDAVDVCLDNAKVSQKLAKVAYSKILINSCAGFANLGVSLEAMVAIEPAYKVCGVIIAQANEGYHGDKYKKLVHDYKELEKAYNQAVNVIRSSK